MFNQLGSIVDKNFVIGFYIPALLLNLFSLILNKIIPVNISVLTSQTIDLSKATVFAAITLGVALLFQAFTQQIYHLVQGNWPWNLRYTLRGPQVAKLKRLKRRYEKMRKTFERLGEQEQKASGSLQRRMDYVAHQLAERFPAQLNDVLPTSFGNIRQAFEDYPEQQYKLDGDEGWFRINAVASQNFLNQISSVQAFCDLWVNMVIVSILLVVESVLVLHHALRVVVPMLFLLAAWGSFEQAKSAALNWGRWIKSAFDVFLLDLNNKLGFKPPQNIKGIREIWEAFSQVIVYHTDDWWEAVDKFRADPAKTPQPPDSGTS